MEEDKAKLEKYRDEVWKKSQYYDGVNEFINDKYHFHNYVDVDIEEKADLPVIDQVAKHFDISYTLKTSNDCYQVVFNMLEHYQNNLLPKAQQAYHENYCRYTEFDGNLIDYCLGFWIHISKISLKIHASDCISINNVGCRSCRNSCFLL